MTKTMRRLFSRAAAVLLVMMLTAATATAQTVINDVLYIAADGKTQTHEAIEIDDANVIGFDDEDPGFLGENGLTTWYVVTGNNVNWSNFIVINGDVHLILADGCHLNIDTSEDNAVYINYGGNLTIYGQAHGAGILSASAGECGIEGNYGSGLTINGGNVTAIGGGSGISGDNLTINGGNVNATSDDGYGIQANSVTINGGTVTATGGGSGIRVDSGTVTLAGGIVKASRYWGTVTVASGYSYTDRNGHDYASGDYDGYEFNAIGDKALRPITDVTYLDEHGDLQTATAAIALAGDETTLPAGTYYVPADITFNHTLTLAGNATLILADGKTMSVNGNPAIDITGGDLTITSQSLGTGTLNANSTNISILASGDHSVTINGGNVNASSYDGGIETQNGDVTIHRGTVSAISILGGAGINTIYGNIAILGGNVTATGGGAGINANAITLGWTNATDRIEASSFSASGNVNIMDGLKMTDGTNIYDDATTSATLKALTNTALYPYIETLALAANPHDGNFWTTFYCGHTGYRIDDGENAWAYTATYSESTLTLHKLGKVIPKQTAVILIGEDNSIGMTASTDPAENSVGNDLHGVDVRTACDDISTTGTFYVMGKQGDDFGFFEYTAEYMPARKAYVLIDGGAALARSLTMVFGDEQTGITATTLTDGMMANDAWYTMDGRRLNGQPVKSGVYVNNGKKIVIK